MQIAVDLPQDFTQLRGARQIAQELRLSYALRLYKSVEVSLSKAAELAGMDFYDFMSVCKQERIPVIDISRDELQKELAGMRIL